MATDPWSGDPSPDGKFRPNLTVAQMTTARLRRELKMLQGFEPKPQWMWDKINDIRAELGWRERDE